MKSVKVSVIIPVYNSGRYLVDALESLVKQSFAEFEVIAINDGSTDNSLEILEEYSKKIEGLRIFSQKNSGVSITRNRGIDMAKGQYITFLDADDLLHKDCLKRLYKTANKYDADIVCSECISFYNKFNEKNDINKQVECISEKYGDLCFEYAMKIGVGIPPVSKLYKKDMLRKYQIYFNPKSSFGEDIFFNWKAFLIAKSIYYCPQENYGYRQHGLGATAKYHKNLVNQYIREYENLYEFANNNEIFSNTLKLEMICNFAQRIPSFFRMDMRMPGKKNSKYCAIKATVDRGEIQGATKVYLGSQHQIKNIRLYRAILSKRYFEIFVYFYYYEIKGKMARVIKRRYKILRKVD